MDVQFAVYYALIGTAAIDVMLKSMSILRVYVQCAVDAVALNKNFHRLDLTNKNVINAAHYCTITDAIFVAYIALFPCKIHQYFTVKIVGVVR